MHEDVTCHVIIHKMFFKLQIYMNANDSFRKYIKPDQL